MNLWHEGRICSFDVETSGVEVHADRIVSAAIVEVGNGQRTETMTWLTDVDGQEIPEGASAVHGISTERARAEGMPAKQAVREIGETLAGAVALGRPIVIYNAAFDWSMLHAELRRHGHDDVVADLEGALIVDPFCLDKWLNRFRRGSRKLAAVCAEHNVSLDDAHDASADALAAARLAWVMCHTGVTVQRRVRTDMERDELIELRTAWKRLRDDLPTLHAAQVSWAAEQARGLREHFERKGDVEAAASVSEEWPMRRIAVV